MSDKKFILNADDFGMSKDFNSAVLSGYNDGFLTSASLVANGNAFAAAVNEILPECPNLGIGVHLNIVEGTPLTECRMLAETDGRFDNSYLSLIFKSADDYFIEQLEKEFRAQIEAVLKYTKADHIDSHVHTHAIPSIFKLVCRLAKEYEIPYIRTQYEQIYFVPELKKHLNFKYPPNILKILLLNNFTISNKKTVAEYGLKTNDYLIGVGYTGLMDDKTVQYGLEAVDEDDDAVVESLIHPCKYSGNINNQHYTEYKITQDKKLLDTISRLGYEMTNYKNLCG